MKAGLHTSDFANVQPDIGDFKRTSRWPHTQEYSHVNVQVSMTINKTPESSSIRISVFQYVIFLITSWRACTCSLHFTLTDWRPLRLVVSSHAPWQRRGHVVHDLPGTRLAVKVALQAFFFPKCEFWGGLKKFSMLAIARHIFWPPHKLCLNSTAGDVCQIWRVLFRQRLLGNTWSTQKITWFLADHT